MASLESGWCFGDVSSPSGGIVSCGLAVDDNFESTLTPSLSAEKLGEAVADEGRNGEKTRAAAAGCGGRPSCCSVLRSLSPN